MIFITFNNVRFAGKWKYLNVVYILLGCHCVQFSLFWNDAVLFVCQCRHHVDSSRFFHPYINTDSARFGQTAFRQLEIRSERLIEIALYQNYFVKIILIVLFDCRLMSL